MTLGYVEAVYRLETELSNTEVSVLAALAAMASEEGCCWYRQSYLASRVRLHPVTVKTTLRALAAKSLISKDLKTDSSGAVVATMIRLDFSPVDLGALDSRGPGVVGSAPPGVVDSGLKRTLTKKKNPPAPKGADEVEEAIRLWNEVAEVNNLPRAIDLTDDRVKKIQARLKAAGIAGWREALAAVSASRHCLGGNDRKWKANLDFVASPSGFAKLREGCYGQDAPRLRLVRAADHDPWPARMQSWTLNRYWNTNDWGPKPGREGCVVPPEHMAAKSVG